jgi:hypothetical protein
MGWNNWRGDELVRLVNKASINAIKIAAEVVLQAAKQEVPLDERTLQDSGTIVMADGNIPALVICFGGGSGTGYPVVPYAIRWHEKNANFQHGRKRFYLRDPLNRLIENALKKAMKQEMERIL